MNRPLVSVIIPVYNGEAYIQECIENMLGQSYDNLEIIIVDDGSVDSSTDIAAKYPITLIRLSINSGISVARNRGMDEANGEYIHFMDVDDSINTDFYNEMVAAITETNSDIACCGMVNEPKPHRTIVFKERMELITITDKLKATNVGKWGFSVRYLFKKSLLEQNKLRFIEGRLIEDLPFSLPAVYYSKKLVTVPNAIYIYLLRENSVMTNRDRSHRKRKHQDLRYAKELRHKFAREHKFRIPGVPTGFFALFFVKWFT